MWPQLVKFDSHLTTVIHIILGGAITSNVDPTPVVLCFSYSVLRFRIVN